MNYGNKRNLVYRLKVPKNICSGLQFCAKNLECMWPNNFLINYLPFPIKEFGATTVIPILSSLKLVKS